MTVAKQWQDCRGLLWNFGSSISRSTTQYALTGSSGLDTNKLLQKITAGSNFTSGAFSAKLFMSGLCAICNKQLNVNLICVGDVQGQDEFQSTLLQIVEVLSQQPGIMLAYPDIFIEQVLPSLAVLYKKNTDGDMRFLCLKVFFDLLVVFLDDISSANSLDSSELPETTGMGALRRYIFPSGLRYHLIALNQCTPFCILNSV